MKVAVSPRSMTLVTSPHKPINCPGLGAFYFFKTGSERPCVEEFGFPVCYIEVAGPIRGLGSFYELLFVYGGDGRFLIPAGIALFLVQQRFIRQEACRDVACVVAVAGGIGEEEIVLSFLFLNGTVDLKGGSGHHEVGKTFGDTAEEGRRRDRGDDGEAFVLVRFPADEVGEKAISKDSVEDKPVSFF